MKLITADMTELEALRTCVENYANPSNYEPYDKDYGKGVIVERYPQLAREVRGEHARETLELIKRKVITDHSIHQVNTIQG